MPRLEPLSIEVLAPEHQELIEKLNELLGFECNDWLTMARVPPIMTAALDLCNSVLESSKEVGEHLRWLVCYACSRSYGCQYCVAHTAFTAGRFGVPDEKLQAIKDFESSEHFSEAERAALRVAVGAGRCPSDVSDAQFEELKQHYNENQIVQIISLVSMMGFFNRWNDTMGTELERPPRQTGETVLKDSGWQLGKHDATS
ncbi:MAG: carboxymuconolactone decarboxylase family protein [Gammaproteobacteria bacterium]|nr:carboxymuconolactone decarboxylase family protein [Gammaproteobacteria bacterium]